MMDGVYHLLGRLAYLEAFLDPFFSKAQQIDFYQIADVLQVIRGPHEFY